MQLKVEEVKRVYRKLGIDTEQSHHKMAYFKYNGKTVIKTRLSHGSGDAKATNQIRQDFKLNEEKFRDLINPHNFLFRPQPPHNPHIRPKLL